MICFLTLLYEWWKLKFRYYLMNVGLHYTDVLNLYSLWVVSTFKKKALPTHFELYARFSCANIDQQYLYILVEYEGVIFKLPWLAAFGGDDFIVIPQSIPQLNLLAISYMLKPRSKYVCFNHRFFPRKNTLFLSFFNHFVTF